MMSPTLHIFSLMSNSQTANTGHLTLHKKPLANIRGNDFPVFDPLEKKYQKKCKKFAFLYCQFKYYSYLCSANKVTNLNTISLWIYYQLFYAIAVRLARGKEVRNEFYW